MKKAYFITYDLNSPEQNYDDVISTIKEHIAGAWCSYWKSSFLITSRLTPNEMLERLKPYLDKDDRFIAIEVVDNKGVWLTRKQWNFINENIF